MAEDPLQREIEEEDESEGLVMLERGAHRADAQEEECVVWM